MSDDRANSETPRRNLSLEEFLPLMLCATGALGILPFAIIRLLHGEWLIGFVDTVIVGGFAVLGMFILHSRRIRVASICITTLGILGMLTTIYLRGPDHLYWAYPALIIAYYLLRPAEAVVASVIVLVSLLPLLWNSVSLFTLTTVLTSILMTAIFAYAFASLTRGQRRQLMNLATRDPLTGAGNRRALTQKIDDVIAVYVRKATPASLLLLDLDHFKAVNDEHGHAAGDQILVKLTNVLNLRIRMTDSLYRIGGEEFVIVLEGQDLERAMQLAEQLRQLIESHKLIPNCGVTVSVGVAELQAGERAEGWLGRADAALYAAKRAGRNATRVADEANGIHSPR